MSRWFPNLVMCWALLGVQAFACQETLIEYRLSNKFILLDADGLPLRSAPIVVREAFGQPSQPTRLGLPAIGRSVRRGATDSHGRFNMKGLKGQQYWVSYDDPNEGQSFLLTREKQTRHTLERKLKQLNGACYLVDIEHNATRPPGWPRPIDTENSN